MSVEGEKSLAKKEIFPAINSEIPANADKSLYILSIAVFFKPQDGNVEKFALRALH